MAATMSLRMKRYTVTSAVWHLLRPSGSLLVNLPLPHTNVSSMRAAAGPSVKSALSHTYVLDTRDDRFMATRGFYFRFHQELAGASINIPVSAASSDGPAATTQLGLGGDASFYKAETEAQISRPISHGIVSYFIPQI
jgi:outer membrane protein assembly factor BamA